MSCSVRIDGATRLYAIVGDPIAQVRSPAVFTERFAADGLNAILFPAQVAPEQFESVFPALMALGNLDGLIVTVPFKSRAIAFATRLGAEARCIGALNALRRENDGSWTGEMFDGTGFVRAAESKGQRISGRHVALYGAGGAGSAIACALAGAGVRSIDIMDPQPARAESLVGKLRAVFPGCGFTVAAGMPEHADMVINASTVGMRPDDGLPGAIGPLSPDALVGDVILSDAPTPLLRHAQRFGCNWVSGTEMLAGQADAIANFLSPARLPAR